MVEKMNFSIINKFIFSITGINNEVWETLIVAYFLITVFVIMND